MILINSIATQINIELSMILFTLNILAPNQP